VSEWQPIATAPRNGSEILAWDELGFCAVVYWDDARVEWTNGDIVLQPTHWMPLPKGPKASNKGSY
jgi:hypothetical protein